MSDCQQHTAMVDQREVRRASIQKALSKVHLMWVERDLNFRGVGGVTKSLPLSVEKEVVAVFTLKGVTSGRDTPPVLTGGHDVFIEDYVHDWGWRKGVLSYHSRVSSEGWIGVVYREDYPTGGAFYEDLFPGAVAKFCPYCGEAL